MDEGATTLRSRRFAVTVVARPEQPPLDEVDLRSALEEEFRGYRFEVERDG